MSKRDIVVLSAVRTAIGDYGGSLKDFAPSDLGARVVREAIARSGADAEQIQHGVIGSVLLTEPKDVYMSRLCCVNGGMPHSSQAMTVNRLCGSGLQAILTASQYITLGETDFAVGGGTDSMSRTSYIAPALRWGARMGDAKLVDLVLGALADPFEGMHMAITAENSAEKWGITRQMQDELAAESHRRAAAAIAAGHFKSQILPIEIPSRKGTVIFDTDEHVRGETTVEGLSKLKPAFKKDGTVTPGNASSLNDGAAALVLAEASAADQRGLKPMARLVAYATAGVDPRFMGEGPIPAVKLVLQRAGLKLADIDVIEANEAFAAQALAVAKGLDLDPAKTNPNGSGISLGHPIGATGALITVKALHELQRVGGKYALVTMCIGGGQGIAAVFERL